MEKKQIKKTCRWIAFGLLLYTLLQNIVVMVDMVIKAVIIMMTTPDYAEAQQKLDGMLTHYLEDGTSMIVAVVLGTLFLWLWFVKKIGFKEIFKPGKPMTVKTFLKLLCLFMSVQFVFGYVYELMEWLLNLIGYSAEASMEMVTTSSSTISMFLYVAFIGPIVEELIYRGFVLRHLEKHGKMFAIIVSASLFGIMHANLPQNAFAFGVGLILAYVAMEYSVVWSIAIHIFNNFVLCELFNRVMEQCSEPVQTIGNMALLGIPFLISLGIVWHFRKGMKQYLVEHKTVEKSYLYAFTTVGMILFIGVELFTAIIMLQKL